MTDGHVSSHVSAGVSLWEQITAAYELAPDEEEVLYQACLAADLLDRIHRELAASPSLLVKGSTGQPTANPLIASAAAQQRVLVALLDKLRLRDAEDAPVDLPADVVRLLPRTANG